MKRVGAFFFAQSGGVPPETTHARTHPRPARPLVRELLERSPELGGGVTRGLAPPPHTGSTDRESTTQ